MTIKLTKIVSTTKVKKIFRSTQLKIETDLRKAVKEKKIRNNLFFSSTTGRFSRAFLLMKQKKTNKEKKKIRLEPNFKVESPPQFDKKKVDIFKKKNNTPHFLVPIRKKKKRKTNGGLFLEKKTNGTVFLPSFTWFNLI